MALVLDRGGTPLDHVAIGVPDTKAGVAQMAERLGYEPFLFDPHPQSFYWSGGLSLGKGKFLEILGPNPTYKGFNPFIELVKRLEGPRPLFWYVATDDFEAFCAAAKEAGGPVGRITQHKAQHEGATTDFIRGIIGPGFLSVCPNVIQWRERMGQFDEGPGPEFLGLELAHPEADRINAVFARLGIDQHVDVGAHFMRLRLGTPKGEVEFAGEGMEFRGFGALITMAGLFARWLFSGRR
ncbi:MAG: VOC family protein [Pseudomonadota bacterium]